MPGTSPRAVIDADLLNALMDGISEFGATPMGGVDRPALTDAHIAARNWFKAQMAARGYRVKVDAIGNLFGQIELAGPDAPFVMIGSHLDSQPLGGRFDGAYGVVAALTAVESFRAGCERTGTAPNCNYVVADWMNEEGARFTPSLLGSSVFSGENTLAFALSRRDRDGRSVEDELKRTGYAGTETPPQPVAYLELHIEGGVELENAGKSIAPFARYWGALKVRIEVSGEQAHTGSAPMGQRKDALLGAAYIMAEVRRLADTAPATLNTSVARLEISPNSANIVPEKVVMFCELRSPEPAMLEWSRAGIEAALPALAQKAQVTARIAAVDHRQAGRFDSRLVKLVETVADEKGYARMELATAAGHDAVTVQRRIPSIVVAVPSVGGVIHRYDEYTSPEDLAKGADVLLGMICRIDTAKGDLDKATTVRLSKVA